MPHAESQLDSRIEIVTPENIAFQHRVAGPFRRLPAYLIDFAIRLLALLMMGLVLLIAFSSAGLGNFAMGFVFLGWFVLSWFYGGLFEAMWNGQTPGKRLLNLRVVTTEGQPITALQAVLRNVLRAVDSMPIVPLPFADSLVPVLPLYLFGLVAPMMNHRFQRLGDLACGTMVVIEEREQLRGVVNVAEPEVIELVQSLPANCRVSRSLTRALSAYVERRRYLGVGRRAEIARVLGEPLAERFNLPATVNHDALLTALYYRVFVTDRAVADGRASSGRDKPPAPPFGLNPAAATVVTTELTAL
jgi:uncharacterized RDD family membrane protein YckC